MRSRKEILEKMEEIDTRSHRYSYESRPAIYRITYSFLKDLLEEDLEVDQNNLIRIIEDQLEISIICGLLHNEFSLSISMIRLITCLWLIGINIEDLPDANLNPFYFPVIREIIVLLNRFGLSKFTFNSENIKVRNMLNGEPCESTCDKCTLQIYGKNIGYIFNHNLLFERLDLTK